MRVGASGKRHMRRVGEFDVVDVLGFAAKEPRVFDALHASADVLRGHTCGELFSGHDTRSS